MSLNSTVISFVPFRINEEKPGLLPPRFFIPPSDMKVPQLLKIGTCYHYVYLDEARPQLRVPDPSDQVAKSIVEDYISSQLAIDDIARPALFWVPEDIGEALIVKVRFKELVEELLERQKKWFLNISMLADNDWNRYHQYNVVSDMQRKCAEIIGWRAEEHAWMVPGKTMNAMNCPACGTSISKDLAVCPNCSVILDKEKAKGLEFAVRR